MQKDLQFQLYLDLVPARGANHQSVYTHTSSVHSSTQFSFSWFAIDRGLTCVVVSLASVVGEVLLLFLSSL